MKDNKTNRTELLQVRLTPKESTILNSKFSNSTCRKRSEYIRRLLLDKPITVKQRNQSLDDFMAELITLRKELNALGNNFNQVIKKLHPMQQSVEVKTWLMIYDSTRQLLLKKVEEIKLKITQINDQWLQ